MYKRKDDVLNNLKLMKHWLEVIQDWTAGETTPNPYWTVVPNKEEEEEEEEEIVQ